jgi:tRNA threonylcarbamoyladenosine biosynthesis protein TsaB
MSLILHIQTALENAMTGISSAGQLLATRENHAQKEHASFLQPSIRAICAEIRIRLADIDAVAVVAGPGSYTGLRVGMAGAKGICFALRKPLITINTLRWMAVAAEGTDTDFICPMIDARRMDVFTALYTGSGETVMDTVAITLDKSSFAAYLDKGRVSFFGSGAAKFRPLVEHAHALFPEISPAQEDLAKLSWNLYQARIFSDLRLSAPQYGKAFFSSSMP